MPTYNYIVEKHFGWWQTAGVFNSYEKALVFATNRWEDTSPTKRRILRAEEGSGKPEVIVWESE